jgi:hypothetical protein
MGPTVVQVVLSHFCQAECNIKPTNKNAKWYLDGYQPLSAALKPTREEVADSVTLPVSALRVSSGYEHVRVKNFRCALPLFRAGARVEYGRCMHTDSHWTHLVYNACAGRLLGSTGCPRSCWTRRRTRPSTQAATTSRCRLCLCPSKNQKKLLAGTRSMAARLGTPIPYANAWLLGALQSSKG